MYDKTPYNLFIECRSCGIENNIADYVPSMLIFCSQCREQLINIDIIENNNHTLLLAMDGINSRDYTVQGVMGLEYGYKDIAYVRFGNRFGHDTAKWSVGGGVRVNGDGYKVGLDYAYVNYDILDYTHQFGINFEF